MSSSHRHRHTSHHFLAVTTTLLAVLLTLCTAFVDEDIGFEVAEDFEVEFDPESSRQLFEVPPQLTAVVGRVFHYALPKEEHVKYEAKRVDVKSLPAWLLFDKVAGVFWGLPLAEDEGKIHAVVKTIRANDTSSNEFTLIAVREQPDAQSKRKCPEGEGNTVLSLVVDRDVHAIKPKQRIIAINNIAKFFGLPYSAFKLEPYRNSDDLSDSSVILAGPGTVRVRSSKTTASILVNVGCDGRLSENAATIVHQLKQQARDGTITEVLRLPLIGWRVKAETETRGFRARRQADEYGGAGSGDYEDEYYDDNNDYYDYDDEETKVVTPRTTTTTTKATRPTTTTTTTTTPAPTTTSTTTMSTTTSTTTTEAPTTVIQVTTPQEATSTHHHRHHHGQLPSNPTFFDSRDTSSSSTTPSTTIKTTTEEVITTTHKHVVATEKTDEIPLPGNADDQFNYDDEDEEEYEDEDDPESETELPDFGQLPVDVKPHLELVTERDDAFPDVQSTKIIELVPETTPLSTTTSTTTTTTTTTTTPMPATTTIAAVPVTSTSSLPSTTTLAATTQSTTVEQTESTTVPDTPPTTLVTEAVTTTTTTTTTERPTTEAEPETTTSIKQTTVRHLPTTTQSASTAAQTETVEFELKNFPPSIQNRLKRIATTAGKAFNYIVPLDTFTDVEDGTDLVLELLDADGKALNKSSWCQFNQGSREIYGLPLDDDVSRWEYILRATDHEGASVQDVVEILVQNHKSKRVVNHEFSLYLHVEKKWEFPHDVDWALKTLRGVGQLYRSNLSDIVVRKVNYTSEPVVFVWTNDSLAKNYCPKEDIEKLYEALTANNEGDPSHALTRALIPELRIKKVLYHTMGICETEPAKPPPPPLAPITPSSNFSPILRNAVDHINATVGELLVFAVPDDTFYDPEDTDPRNLKMSLLTAEGHPIPSNYWLQFDSKNKEFYGIPLLDNVGRKEFQLVCKDSGNLTASDMLVVVVHSAPRRHYNLEFIMTLDTQYESFATSASMQRKFVEKVADLFGDSNTSNIHLNSIRRGSTIVSWYNKSLTLDECPRPQISQLESVLVNKDHTIAGRVQDVMDPEFKVSTIKLQLIGNCRGKPHIHSPNSKGVPIEEPPLGDHDDYMITFIVPAIIIFCMLLLAGIVACVMYRRRRTGKLNMAEDGRSSYGNKGIPVIFQEELEEKPEPGTKAPVILKDEKPPLAPPEYSKSGSLKLGDDSEPYQPPPPPFSRPQDNNRQARPKPTPTYRKPPPLSID
ncbi:dystroglycan 1 [Atheta coriaria]|uniref:dystroglycan 1 n=1 Tax=Dalotia coriaria TaxID=877792 RepID=UPI0031F3714D